MRLHKKSSLILCCLLGFNITAALAGPIVDNEISTIASDPINTNTLTGDTTLQLTHEAGLDTALAYVSDLKEYWPYSSLYYYRLTNHGKFGGRVNVADRYAKKAVQYQLEAYPLLFKGAYAAINLGYANTAQTLFPSYQYKIEGYFTLPYALELSLGAEERRFPHFSNKQISTYTGSLGKYVGNYFLWIRPYYYKPISTLFYEMGVIRTFTNQDTYLTLRINSGKLPDISDLPPLDNFITINQKELTFGGQLPLTQHLFSKIDIGYARQVFPSKQIRKIITGYLSFFIRF